MPSKQFLQTMISHRPKQIFLKFEILTYNKNTKKFEKVDESVVQERKLPNGVSNISGGININIDQDIRTTLDLQIINANGINNWGTEFDPDNTDEFKWWLDKRLNVSIGLMLDNTKYIEYVRMGHFLITHFKTNHNLTNFPVTEIKGSSKEALYATRRGKFLYATTIEKNTVMTDTIRTLLLNSGELEENIMIDPQINTTSIKLDDGETFYGWVPKQSYVGIELDSTDKAHGDSSIKIDVNTQSSIKNIILAEKTFDIPVNMSRINSIALWLRSTTDLNEGDLSLVLINDDGVTRDLPLRELVGHVVNGSEIVALDNWRNIILPVKNFEELNHVRKLQLRVNSKSIQAPFTIWLDQIYCAEIRNMLPHKLTYGAGQNKWLAIKELANLLDCHAYYNEYGQFILQKRKFPKERYSADFEYDAYEVLQPVITYCDKNKKHNLYAGTDDLFEEHELSNHIQVVGGSTTSSVITLVDMALYCNGLHIREKGKVINRRGKIRAIDQFYNGEKPTVLNSKSDVAEIYKGHQNLEAVINDYPNGFPHLEQPPISNFAIEKIGDFIYQHNYANPDPLIMYAYEGKNRALWELRKRLAYSEQLNILSAPYYILRGGDIIRVEDSLLELNDNFQIKSISIPLNGDYMSISANKIRNLMIDVPYFDISPLKHNACWYGYDVCGLTFPFPL